MFYSRLKHDEFYHRSTTSPMFDYIKAGDKSNIIQSWILHQESQQCQCVLSGGQLLLNDLYDKQTSNWCSKCSAIHLTTTFSISVEMKGRLEISFLNQQHHRLIQWSTANNCYRWQKMIHPFFQKSTENWIEVTRLVRRLTDCLFEMNIRSWSKRLEHLSNHDIHIHEDVAGIIGRIQKYMF